MESSVRNYFTTLWNESFLIVNTSSTATINQISLHVLSTMVIMEKARVEKLRLKRYAVMQWKARKEI